MAEYNNNRIEILMRHLGMNARKLAMSVGVSPQTIYDIQKGKHGISKDLAEKISAKYLNVSRLWLLTGEGEMLSKENRIPLYDDDVTIGGVNGSMANVDDAARPTEWIDAGDWFPNATSAIHHYGDSMTEYPSGCILALKRVNNPSLLINGENYVIETDEFRITKQIQDDGDCIVAYSSNTETYPDGRLIHAPIRIPKESIRHLDLVLGCVIRKFSAPIRIK
jgi:transcriptional regulator with XRE-family HTH domain